MSKFCGLYKGTVVNNQDPNNQMRIIAKVPQLFGPIGQTGWALPCYPLALIAPPKMGDPVWLMFESGDEDHPVYIGTWSSWDTQIAEATVENLVADLAAINSTISGLPATSVTGPDAFGDSPVIGTSTKYARQDHNHGLPVLFDGIVPSTQAFGDTAVTGSASVAARRDHKHGFPAAPVDSGWIAPTLQNGWVNYGAPYASAGYRKIGNQVYLRGMVKSGTVGTTIFTLPTGYRIPFDDAFPCSFTGTIDFNYVQASGNVSQSTGTSNASHSLACSFLVD